MSAGENLNPQQFVTVHRGVADWGGQDWDGRKFGSAEDWKSAHDVEREGFGQWWGDEDTARHYGMHGKGGLVVSARFPAKALHTREDASGYVVNSGQQGSVQQVIARDNDGTERVLPHKPGMRIKA